MINYLDQKAKLIKNKISSKNPILIHQAHHTKNLPYHYHNIIQILFLIKGEAILYLNNKKYRIKDSDLIYINRGDKHKLSPDLTKSVVYVLEFDKNIINKNNKYSDIFSFFNNLNDADKIISVSSPNLSKIIMNFKEMLFESQHKYPDYKFFLENRLIDILLTIKRYYSIKEPEFNKINEDTYNKNLIKNILNYIDSHYYEKLTLDSISQIANISKRQFTRIFKKITGITFVEYLNNIRIKKAQEMLSTTDNEIIYICFEVGFNDLSYFYRIFKNQVGMTPKDYMKLHSTKL